MRSTIKQNPVKFLSKILVLLTLLLPLATPVAAKTPLSPYLPVAVKNDSQVLPGVNDTETLNTGQPQLNFFFPAGYEPAYAHNATPTLAAALTYASYVGGGGADEGKGVAVDRNGNIYLIGNTASNNFLGSGHSLSGYSDIFCS